MILAQSRGELAAKIGSIWVKHPRAELAFNALDDIREAKRLSDKRCEAGGLTLLAPSRSGKSRTVKQYIASRVVPDCIKRGLLPEGASLDDAIAAQRLVIYVTLESPSSVGALMTDLLVALGDLDPTGGTIKMRRHRVYTLLRENKTELLIFDEIQHLGRELGTTAQKTREAATSVQNSIKKFLLDGFPVCFVGLPEARTKILSDVQIALRIEEEIDFSPLDDADETHVEWVKEFCGRMAAKLYVEGVYDHIVDLVSNDFPECFCDAVNGRLGLVTELIRWATILAFGEGAETLTRAHLARAVDKHLIGKDDVFDSNPFADAELAELPLEAA